MAIYQQACTAVPYCSLRRKWTFLCTHNSISGFLISGPFLYLCYLLAFEMVTVPWSWAETGAKLICFILLEPVCLSWEQQPCLDICLPPGVCQPLVAWAELSWPPSSVSLWQCLHLFSCSPSAQHAVCQGLAPSEGEGGYPACAYRSEWRPELWVVSAVLYAGPFSSGHGGLWGEEKRGLFADYISERGESKWTHDCWKMEFSSSYVDAFICP